MARLGAKERAQLPDSAFAYIDSRGRRRLPIHDAPHVRNALARFSQVAFEDEGARDRARSRLLRAAQKHGIEDDSFESLSSNETVIAAVQEGIDRANEQLARVEQIKKFKILPTDWEPGGDELTPTMKLKRKPIHEKYADEIEELYAK